MGMPGQRIASQVRRGIGGAGRSGDGRCRLVLILACLFPTLTQAADGPRMENTLPVSQAREGGPLYLTGELQWDRPELLEGRLRYVVRDERSELSTVVTDPVVVPAGGIRLRQLLPVPQSELGFGMTEVVVSFVEEDRVHRLGEVGVSLSRSAGAGSRTAWTTVLLSIEPSSRAGLGEGDEIHRQLEITQAFENPADINLVSLTPVIAANELSEQPLPYCAFDGVLVPTEAFRRLSLRQLAALSDWARAGGALCVMAKGPLEQKQADFLDQLFRGSDVGPFIRDSDGKLIEPAAARDGIFTGRAGVGFAMVLFRGGDEIDFSSSTWRQSHARFWRLRDRVVRRRGHQAEPIKTDFFRPQVPATPDAAPTNRRVPYYPPYQTYDYSVLPAAWTFPTPGYGTTAIEALRPQDIRLLPGWVVVLILFGYIGIVGPGEYLLLGRLKRRKWTWITFPAITIALTWAVVATANAFMSSNDETRSIELIDLDAAGEPVRRTKLELQFRGDSARILHESQREFFSPLDPKHFVPSYNQFGQTSNIGNDAPTGPFVGSYPRRYVTPQTVAKWTPQVNRVFEIAPAITIPKIDWKRFETGTPRGPISLPGGRVGHVARITSAGAQGDAAGIGRLADDSLRHQQAYAIAWQQANAAALQNGVEPPPPGGEFFLSGATAAEMRERSSLQFQRSPLGLGRLDDLPFVDSTASDDGAMIVWSQDKAGNFTIYRKPFTPHTGAETP